MKLINMVHLTPRKITELSFHGAFSKSLLTYIWIYISIYTYIGHSDFQILKVDFHALNEPSCEVLSSFGVTVCNR